MTPTFDPNRYYVAALALSMPPQVRENFAFSIQNRPATRLEALKIADSVYRKATARARVGS